MTYFIYLESGFASDADNEEDAIEEGRQALIEQLQRGEVDFSVDHEED